MMLVQMAKSIISLQPYVQGKHTLKIQELMITSKIIRMCFGRLDEGVSSGYISHVIYVDPYLSFYHAYSNSESTGGIPLGWLNQCT